MAVVMRGDALMIRLPFRASPTREGGALMNESESPYAYFLQNL